MAKDLTLQLYLFIAGYIAEHIGNAIMIYKLQKQKSMYGISIDTQICLFLSTLARVFWQFDTQLSKLYMSQLEILVALGMHAYILYLCFTYKDSIYKGTKEVYLKWYALAGACFLLCLVFHPGSKGKYIVTLQMLVSFTMFLEAVALVPQLIHLNRTRDPEGLTSQYLYALGGCRAIRFFFWLSYESFWYLILADLLHTALLIGFFYFFKQALKSGGPIIAAFSDQKVKNT